jgi:hypothetical protein
MSTPDYSPESGPRISLVSVRRPTVMLIRIDPGHEPTELGLGDLPVSVLRVRHPLPACLRMRILLPEAILVGPSVQPRDLSLLMDAAYETQAALMPLAHMVGQSALRPWLLRMLDVVRERRDESPAARQAG